MAIGGAIAAILAGLAAGASEGIVKKRQKEEEITRSIMQKSAFERASKGDTGFADNPDMSKVLGKQGVQALLSYAQQIQQQNAETEAGDTQARTAMFGTDPLGGLAIGKHGGTMAGTGGGPTVTGGPGGAVSVQQPGTGRTIPSLAPPQALAQSVAGPAALGIDDGSEQDVQASVPVPTPPMGPAAPAGAAPPVAPPPGAPATPQTGLERIQSGLKPGQSVSGKAGGVSFNVSGRDPGEKADEVGRRIIAEGIKAKRRPDEMIVDVFAAGGKLPENFSKYGETVFVPAFRQALKEAGVDTKSATTAQKIAATRAALESGGSVPDAFKSMIGFTREDEHALAGEVVARALNEGVPFAQARAYAEARGLRLSPGDETAFGQRTFGELRTELGKLLPELAPEQLDMLAATGVKNDPRFVPPDVRAAIREAAPMSEATRAKVFEETGKVPRLSDIGKPGDIAGARTRAEGEATDVAATRAGAVEQATQDVERRLPEGAQEKIVALNNSIAAGQRIFAGYKSEYVGPAKARIDNLKEKFIDKALPAAESKFRSDLQDFLNDAIFQITGKQVGSVNEAERILGPLPNINLPASAFEARLSALRERLHQKREEEGKMARSQRYRAPAPPPAVTEAPPPPPAVEGSSMSPEEQRLRKRLGIK
jgi:hypothetical protein